MFAVAPGSAPWRASLQSINWTAIGLAAAVVLLDLAHLMLYRAGFNVSLGQLVTPSVAALVCVANC